MDTFNIQTSQQQHKFNDRKVGKKMLDSNKASAGRAFIFYSKLTIYAKKLMKTEGRATEMRDEI